MEVNERLEKLAADSGDPDLIARAWRLASSSHQGQRRASGEDFITHPLAVAEILSEEGLEAQTIAAALLHDSIEDSGLDLQELASELGSEVAAMVDGVTKIQRVAPQGSKARRQSETYRKMVIAASDDARVLVLKLADRLHNMRTISALSPERQRNISRETLEVYAPLAMRLGMARFREELEDRAFEVLDPDGFHEAELLRREQGRLRSDELDQLEKQVTAELLAKHINPQVSTRVKSRYSVSRKLLRAQGEIYDIVGVRILVANADECYQTLGVVHSLYTPRFDRLRDYIARPKTNGYQSLHTTVIGPRGTPVEIQIRTAQMHQAAEHGLAAHWLYKEKMSEGGPRETQQWLERLSEHTSLDADQMLAAMREEVFREEVWVFTPKGQMQVLPRGATAVDFAYAVHTELGHSCAGAKVNGLLASLDTPLQSGDVVEVIRGDSAPRRSWLQTVVSPRARARIKAYWAARDKPGLSRRGQEILEEEIRSAGLYPLSEPVLLQAALRDLGYADPGKGFAEAADRQRAVQLVERMVKRLAVKQPLDRGDWREAQQMGVTVAGMPELWVRTAGCCKVLPGQPAKGRVCMGGGVVLHRAGCPQLTGRRTGERVRLLPVNWTDANRSVALTTELELVCRDRTGLMSALSEQVYQLGLDLEDVVLHSRRGLVRGALTVRLVHHAQQQVLLDSMREIDGVLSVKAIEEAQ